MKHFFRSMRSLAALGMTPGELQNQRGFALLSTTLILLLVLTIMSIFTARTVIQHQTITANLFKTQQAFEAAQAGMEYAITYLNDDPTAVTNWMVLGASLSDGSSYQVQYQYLDENGTLMRLDSTGTSADGTATRTIMQKIKLNTAVTVVQVRPATTRGPVILDGNASITNLENDSTITSGSTVTFSGTSQTILSGGTGSNGAGMGPDVVENDPTLSAMTPSAFEMATLGRSIASMQYLATENFSYGVNHDYAGELAGLENVTIWITQTAGTASLSGGVTIGSAENPVNLIINGPLTMMGNITVYGNVIATGDVQMVGGTLINGLLYSGGNVSIGASGTPMVEGAVVVDGQLDINGNASIIYNSTMLQDALSAGGSYGKIPGSWKG